MLGTGIESACLAAKARWKANLSIKKGDTCKFRGDPCNFIGLIEAFNLLRMLLAMVSID